MAQKKIILRMNFGVEECLRRLCGATDPPRWTPFSLSGYAGSKPLLAKIDGQKVKIWKRIYYRNNFRTYFFGRIIPEGKAARMEGHFAMQSFVKFFVWLFVGLIAVATISRLIASRHDIGASPQNWLIFVVPWSLVPLAFLVAKWIGGREEQFVLDSLQEALGARVEIIDSDSAEPEISENRPLG
jgi:hypothetical protein